VTGASGFIGSHLCRALIARGHAVRAFHRPDSSLVALQGLPVEHAVGDVRDATSLRAAAKDVDWVFHAAGPARHWRRPDELVDTIVRGTINVLQAAEEARARRVVFTSSVAALGVPVAGALLDEGDRFNCPRARWPYGHAKSEAESAVRAAVGQGLDCVIVNPSAVFGAADLNRISGTLILILARHPVPVITRGGTNVVHVADVAEGHVAAAERGRPGERYILGGENLRHVEIARTIAAELGVRPPRLTIPPRLVDWAAGAVDLIGRVARLPADGNLLRLSRYGFYCDTAKARRDLGLDAPRPFRQAVREAVAWYRAHGYLGGRA
jgi:dihydroflavonol-4-reductase